MKATQSNWTDYLYFLKIAEYRNLQKAAQVLNVNSSTVYRRLNALEKRMDRKLFKRSRSHQGYDITLDGEEILKKLQGVENLFKTIEENFMRDKTQISGHINIGVSDGIGEFWLYNYIQRFKEIYPKINIEIITIRRSECLERKELDFSFVIAQKPLEYMKSHKIQPISMCLCAHKDFISKYQNIVENSKKLQKDIDVIMPGGQLKQFSSVYWLYSQRNKSVFSLKSDNFLSLYHYATQKLGATILPEYIAHGGDLQCIEELPKEFSVYLWLLTYTEQKPSAVSQLFIKFLSQELKKQRAEN